MPTPDPRHLDQGRPIGQHAYMDQPNLVHTDDGAWLCVMTVGKGDEGSPGQHVVSSRSTDRGATWEPSIPIEPADGPEASWAVAVKGPERRIFVFYVHNTDNLRQVQADPEKFEGGYTKRVDSLGHLMMRWSDDDGRSWSSRRVTLPIREGQIDRDNAYGGDVRFFWFVASPVVADGSIVLPFAKVGGFGEGFFTSSECWFLRSDNLLTVDDPANADWRTLPDGEHGLTAPQGPIAEEPSLTVLADGSLCCVYRTIAGHPGIAYSRDRGHTWTAPAFMTNRPGGQRIKQPRAASFVWPLGNGEHLHWSHVHSRAGLQPGASGYRDRNPAWVRFGVEVEENPSSTNGQRIIHWSEPEILLYDDDPVGTRISYPDLIHDEDGGWYISETQKTLGRIHRIPNSVLLARDIFTGRTAPDADASLVLHYNAKTDATRILPMPMLPLFQEEHKNDARLDHRGGFTLELSLTPPALVEGEQRMVLDTHDASLAGLSLRITRDGRLELTLSDGRLTSAWVSDATLKTGQRAEIGLIIDGGPKLISFVVDGRLHDGGTKRDFGWGRFHPLLLHANGSSQLRIETDILHDLRIHDRVRSVNALAVAQSHRGISQHQSAP